MSLIPGQGTKMAQASPHGQIFAIVYVVVLSLSHIWLFATPWTAACQAPLSSPVSQRFLKFMSIELLMLSNHLILCHPISFLHILLSSCSVMSDSLQPHGLQHTRLACPSPSPGACSNSCPLSQWCPPAISSSVIPFSCLQTSPASGSFLMSQLFTSGSQSIGASPSILSMNIQGWFPLGWTGLISLQSKGFSRVFSNTTVQKHQFFGAQPSLWSNSHNHSWLLEKP